MNEQGPPEGAAESVRPPVMDRFAVEHAALAVFWAREDGSLVDANEAAAGMLGLTREALRALRVPDIDAGLAPGEWRVRWQRMKTRRYAKVETGLRHADGSTIPVELILNFAELEGAGYICAYARDIRPEKQKEADLKNTEELFRALMENTLDLVTILDGEGVIRYVNPAMERLLGFTVSERLGAFAFDLVHPDDVQPVLADFVELARSRRFSTALGVRLWHKRGEWRYFDAAATNLLDNPAVRGIVVHSRDVTDRKLAEIALRQSESELRALAGRLIQGEEDEARLLSRELHDDFTQRLTAISLALGELERQRPPRVPEDWMARHQRLQAMVEAMSEDLRRLAHRLHPAVIDLLGLSAALKQLCDESPSAGGPLVHFNSRRGCDCPVDRGQALCLYRVAQEALRNAIKHSGAQEVWVELAGSAGQLRLTVRDNGSGFDGAPAAPRRGLGLISMKERVRLAGGSLHVESQPGQGTRLSAAVPVSLTGPGKAPQPRPDQGL